jgi:hypothetical protein
LFFFMVCYIPICKNHSDISETINLVLIVKQIVL